MRRSYQVPIEQRSHHGQEDRPGTEGPRQRGKSNKMSTRKTGGEVKIAQEISGTADPAGLRAIRIPSRLSWGPLGDGGGRGDLGTRPPNPKPLPEPEPEQKPLPRPRPLPPMLALPPTTAGRRHKAHSYSQGQQSPTQTRRSRWQVGKVLTDAHSTLAFSRHPVGEERAMSHAEQNPTSFIMQT